ncbi:MAG: hypothetical protein ACLFVU_01625 [Phycisphaerae bacterium]
MALDQMTYERLARQMDGETGYVSPEHRHVAREVQETEAELANLLDVPMPDGVMQRMDRLVQSELAERQKARGYRLIVGIAVSAVAAAVLVVLACLPNGTGPQPARQQTALVQSGPADILPAGDLAGPVEMSPADDTTTLLSREIEQFESDLVDMPPLATDVGPDSDLPGDSETPLTPPVDF